MAGKVNVLAKKYLRGSLEGVGVIGNQKFVGGGTLGRALQRLLGQILIECLGHYFRRIEDINIPLKVVAYLLFDERVVGAREYQGPDIAQRVIAEVLINQIMANP